MNCTNNTFRYNTKSILQEFTITQTQVRRIIPSFKILRLCPTPQKKKINKENLYVAGRTQFSLQTKMCRLTKPIADTTVSSPRPSYQAEFELRGYTEI